MERRGVSCGIRKQEVGMDHRKERMWMEVIGVHMDTVEEQHE